MGSLGSESANYWNGSLQPDALSQMSQAGLATACVTVTGSVLSEESHSKSAQKQRRSYSCGDPRLALGPAGPNLKKKYFDCSMWQEKFLITCSNAVQLCRTQVLSKPGPGLYGQYHCSLG